MAVRLELALFAPIAVGNHVTVIPLDRYVTAAFERARWEHAPDLAIVCDDSTKIVYARSEVGEPTYGNIVPGQGFRVAASKELRGHVLSCTVLTDVTPTTILTLEPDPDGYR